MKRSSHPWEGLFSQFSIIKFDLLVVVSLFIEWYRFLEIHSHHTQ